MLASNFASKMFLLFLIAYFVPKMMGKLQTHNIDPSTARRGVYPPSAEKLRFLMTTLKRAGGSCPSTIFLCCCCACMALTKK
jgi:hypothetical protein